MAGCQDMVKNVYFHTFLSKCPTGRTFYNTIFISKMLTFLNNFQLSLLISQKYIPNSHLLPFEEILELSPSREDKFFKVPKIMN